MEKGFVTPFTAVNIPHEDTKPRKVRKDPSKKTQPLASFAHSAVNLTDV
jgi:hypothetical protein